MKIFVISPIIESENIKQKGTEDFLKTYFAGENAAGEEVEIASLFLAKGPTSIETEIDDAVCVPGLLEAALYAKNDGAQGILVDCMCDPGVKALRCALDIPVIGPAETAFHLAATLGHRFSVIDVGEDTGPMVEDLVTRHGLMGKFASIRGTSIPVEDIGSNKGATVAALYKTARLVLEQDHADVIVFGCTGFCEEAVAVRDILKKGLNSQHATEYANYLQGIDLSKTYNVPVIEPMTLAVRTLISFVKEGYCHSKKAFPTPGKKGLHGYDLPSLYNIV